MTKIFITGATGFIGGEVLYQLYHAQPTYQIAALVRGRDKAAEVDRLFPRVRVVVADLEDGDVLEKEARLADVVLHLATTGHVPSAQAIAQGLGSGQRSQPAYWIQISGASLFSGADISNGSYGEAPERQYNDLKDIGEITNTAQQNPKRVVDQIILSQPSNKVKTALLVGPLIYGTGRGPLNKTSIQAPAIARYILKTGEGFRIGAGKSVWSNIHVQDLGLLCTSLVHAAVNSKDGIWNESGIYLPENGKMSFGELSEHVARVAHSKNLIGSPSVTKVVDPKDADLVTPHGAVLLATNAVLEGKRAREKLGWTPSQPALEDTLAEVVETEAARAR